MRENPGGLASACWKSVTFYYPALWAQRARCTCVRARSRPERRRRPPEAVAVMPLVKENVSVLQRRREAHGKLALVRVAAPHKGKL